MLAPKNADSGNSLMGKYVRNLKFDAQGKATGGPPKEAKQSLSEYPLRVKDGLIFIETPNDTPNASNPARTDTKSNTTICLPR